MPQIENGYTKIANELIEAFSNYRIPGEAMQCLWVILRKTYGFNKKEDRISMSQFTELTGLKKQHVHRAINKLLELNIVTKKGYEFKLTYGINKDFRKWKQSPKKVTVTKKGYESNQKRLQRVTNNGEYKRKKETITKERWMEAFFKFYKEYPNKKSKGYAEKAWLKLSPSEELFSLIMQGLEKAKNSKEWGKKDGEYIPHPATWLNAKGWEDEYKQKQERKFA